MCLGQIAVVYLWQMPDGVLVYLIINYLYGIVGKCLWQMPDELMIIVLILRPESHVYYENVPDYHMEDIDTGEYELLNVTLDVE